MAGFSVNIGADTAQLTAGLNQATAEVQKFGSQLAAVPTQAFTTLNTVVQTTTTQFDELAASTAALERINASIDAAAEAATNAGSRFDSLAGRLPLQDFNTFRSSVDRLKSDVATGLVPQISRIPSALNQVTPAANNAANALNKVRPGANQAAAALTNVGRVAQDLPFGFIGIQNNLNPLLESFQRLKAETGSGKAALAALGQSLIGPAGIGIALSVVSSAIVIFQNGIAGFNSKTKEAKDKADEFAKSIRDIALVQQEAAAGVQGQVSQVEALTRVVSDSNKPYEQRKRALEELKDINKSYFGDLKLEDAATGALTKTVDEYTKALINNAIQKGFVDEIASVAKAVAKQDDVITKSKLKLAQAQTEVNNAQQRTKESFTEEQISANAAAASSALNKQKDALEEVRVENSKVTDLLSQQANLRDQLNRAVEEGLKFKDLDTKGDKKEEDLLKKRLAALERIKKATTDVNALVGVQEAIFDLQVKIAVRDDKKRLSKDEFDNLIKGFENELNESFKNQAIALEAIPKIKFSNTSKLDINDIINKAFASKEKIKLTLGENGIEVDVKKESIDITDLKDRISKATGLDKKIPVLTRFEADVKFLGLKAAQLKKAKEDIELKLSETIAQLEFNGQVDIASQIGEAIAESLNSGDFGEVLKKAAQGILSILGSVLQQIGRQVITAALAIKALKATLEKFAIANPGLAVVAGIGLVALGAALKNVKFDGPKFANGGIITGPVIGQIGEMHRPEVIMPLDRLPQMLRSIGGGGGNETQLIPIINNEGLYLAMKRGERRANRKF